MKLIHTADWQIGKPFAGIEDRHKRSLVQQERIEAIKRIGEVAREHDAEIVLMAGDLFDSTSADNATVSAACSAIGEIGIPVVVIPGNHDHGGPGSVWEQTFYTREQESLAPNLHVLLESSPIEIGDAIIFPCPLLRRAETTDPTEWLLDPALFQEHAADKLRIVLAHGSTQDFSGAQDEEELSGMASNYIDLSRLPMDEIDYLALGDWHGTKEINPKAWYSGTPEIDRFQKGEGNRPGHVLLVEPQRGAAPKVEEIQTGRLSWSQLEMAFSDDADVARLEAELSDLLGQRANADLLRLSLSGMLGIEASNQLEGILESLQARLLRLKLDYRVGIAPTDAEVAALTERARDPLIASVATQLFNLMESGDHAPEVVALALRELHAACTNGGAACG